MRTIGTFAVVAYLLFVFVRVCLTAEKMVFVLPVCILFFSTVIVCFVCLVPSGVANLTCTRVILLCDEYIVVEVGSSVHSTSLGECRS